jgi:hypothetical protein
MKKKKEKIRKKKLKKKGAENEKSLVIQNIN